MSRTGASTTPHMSSVVVALVLIAGLGLTGCASTPEPVSVRVAVPVPCRVQVPTVPAWPADSLTGNEDIYVSVKTLWADRLLRTAHIQRLTDALNVCVSDPVQ